MEGHKHSTNLPRKKRSPTNITYKWEVDYIRLNKVVTFTIYHRSGL
jgi:hypothetical protein